MKLKRKKSSKNCGSTEILVYLDGRCCASFIEWVTKAFYLERCLCWQKRKKRGGFNGHFSTRTMTGVARYSPSKAAFTYTEILFVDGPRTLNKSSKEFRRTDRRLWCGVLSVSKGKSLSILSEGQWMVLTMFKSFKNILFGNSGGEKEFPTNFWNKKYPKLLTGCIIVRTSTQLRTYGQFSSDALRRDGHRISMNWKDFCVKNGNKLPTQF